MMKTTLLILSLIMLSLCVYAQDLAMNNYKEEKNAATKDSKAETPFSFTNYGIDLNHSDVTDYPEHMLGDQVARRMAATRKIYVKRQSTSIGYNNNTVEIYKPAIYNTITKLESYFKKAVRREGMDISNAATHFCKCLDVAYVAYYEDDTTTFENILKNEKDPQKLIDLFENIQIK